MAAHSLLVLCTTIYACLPCFCSDAVTNGGWLKPTDEELSLYSTTLCDVPKIPIAEMTVERFESEFSTKPFILTFAGGVSDWCDSDSWSVSSLTRDYDQWTLSAGKSIDIVYNGGKGSFNRTFSDFVAEMRKGHVPGQDLTYLFDRTFYFNSSLPSTIKVPEFLFDKGDPILFIGQSGTGATFHKHMPAWNGVVYGAKRWFLYPMEMTPPGGLYGFTPVDWFNFVYPNLPEEKRPIQCIQNAGEIFYVPESYYHAILNIGETVAISIQSSEVKTEREADFYQAIESHHTATTEEDGEMAERYYEQATNEFLDLHYLLPENTEILYHLGEIAGDRGHAIRCERILKLAVKIDPFAVECIKLLSRVHYTNKDYDECERLILSGLEINPHSRTLLREYANLLWDIRREDSKLAYQKLLEIIDPITEEAEDVRKLLEEADFDSSDDNTTVTDTHKEL